MDATKLDDGDGAEELCDARGVGTFRADLRLTGVDGIGLSAGGAALSLVVTCESAASATSA